MNHLRKMKKNAKALSPVVASIILIAVTVAVSIAVAAWMGGMTQGFMQTEQLSVTQVHFISGTVYINVTNTATTAVTVSSVTMTPSQAVPTVEFPTGFITAPTTGTLPANTAGSISLTGTGLYNVGSSYKITLTTSKGNTFSYTAVAS